MYDPPCANCPPVTPAAHRPGETVPSERRNLRHSAAVDSDGFGHAATFLVFITNPGINLLLAKGIQPCKSNMLGLDPALRSKYPLSPHPIRTFLCTDM